MIIYPIVCIISKRNKGYKSITKPVHIKWLSKEEEEEDEEEEVVVVCSKAKVDLLHKITSNRSRCSKV